MRSDARKALADAADTARAAFNTRGLPGYFVDADAWGDVWIWAECGDLPQPIVGRRHFDDAPDLWAAIVTLVGGPK